MDLPYALGGGLAFSAYSYRQRNTKDVDLFILERDKDEFIRLITELGFEDYFDRDPYDRSWIFRGYRDGVICDLIWTLPNHRLKIDERWHDRGRHAVVHGDRITLIPVEEMIRSKLYILQYDRCDWPDLFNVLLREGPRVDWNVLIDELGDDARLLGALMNVYAWLCPMAVMEIEADVWDRLGILPPDRRAAKEDRAPILDTRNWFGPGYTDTNPEAKKA